MTRILLVEQDDAAAQDMDRALHLRADWEVTRVASLLEAIRAAGDAPFDAVVLDYDLPDGSGLDILDFLRIGSPGIGILLISDRATEEVVFHALSHGVADHLVKDSHLAQELPRRVDAILDRVAEGALVESLHAAGPYEAVPREAPRAGASPAAGPLDRALAAIVGGPILACGVFDSRGKAIATRHFPGADPEGLGFALGTIHGQVGALWTYAELKPVGYEMLIELDAGLLGITAIPGTYVIALLMERATPRDKALERLEMAARRIFEAVQA